VFGKITDSSERTIDVARNRIRDVCVFLALSATLAAPCAVPGQGYGLELGPLFGVWRLNPAESTFASGPPPYKRVTTRIEPWRDGLAVIYDMVGIRGGVTHWEWAGRLDGRDYPLQGVEEVITHAYSRAGDRNYTLTTKVDGRITTTTTIAISSDGRVMTVTSPAVDDRGQRAVNTAIYLKQ
jgi:hypothetical protein